MKSLIEATRPGMNICNSSAIAEIATHAIDAIVGLVLPKNERRTKNTGISKKKFAIGSSEPE